MGIWVKIRKIFQKNDIGYYEVFAQDYDTIEFYMSVDLNTKILIFYLSSDFLKPSKVIDCNIVDQPIGKFNEIPEFTYVKAVRCGLRALNAKNLPEIIDYIA